MLRKKCKLDLTLIIFIILGALILAFVVIPVINLIILESPETLTKALQEPLVRNAILLSLSTAFIATIIASIFGIPLAYVLARKKFWGRGIIQGIIDVPVVVPHTVAGIALFIVFGSQGLIGAPLEQFGIRFVDAMPGIIVAMLFVSAPFLINTARAGFESVDPRLENVARTLGASSWGAFWKVSFPLALRQIFTGAVMSWARAISEFGAVVMLVYYPMIAPVLIYDRFNFLIPGFAGASSIAVLLILACLIVFISLRVLSRRLSYDKG